jgi:hypothetical protein
MSIEKQKTRMTALILTTLLCVFFACNVAFGFTKDELINYHANVKNIVEENMFQLAPGSLKNGPLSPEENQKRTMELMKTVGDTASRKWALDALTFYSGFFKKCAERLATEVTLRDDSLAAWNKKLIAGYQDSYEVTRLALSLLETPDMTGLNKALLTNNDLTKRIRDNQTYHRNIQSELDRLIKAQIPSDMQVQRLARELAGMYVETTWK